MLSDITNDFGYAEMYEWKTVPEEIYGRFVTFDSEDKIKYAEDSNNIIGVTTICKQVLSDNPVHWKGKYISNKFGDVCVHKKQIVEGHKVYDDKDEFTYIKTSLKDTYVGNLSPIFNNTAKYSNRMSRKEWVPVTLIGKCIVTDNGTCMPGNYCTVYSGDDTSKFGTAVPSDNGWRVLKRFSPTTIMILFK